MMTLYNDDQLCAGALSVLADACASETDARVKLWFGTPLIMDEAGVVDPELSAASDRWCGRQGPAAARPMWEWCLEESIPPDAFLVEKASHLQHMRRERDGNVGDWSFSVRLANSGAWARYVGQTVSRYRVQAGSVTVAGRGVEDHRAFEPACELRMPPEHEAAKQRSIGTCAWSPSAMRAPASAAVAPHSMGAWPVAPLVVIALMLLTPRPLWLWALNYKS